MNVDLKQAHHELIDLIYKVLNALNKRYGKKPEGYSAFEVWSYLVHFYPEDFEKLGYDSMSFSHLDMDREVLSLLGNNNGVPFRVHREPAEDDSFFCVYWIP